MNYDLMVFDALPQPATLIDTAGIIVDVNAAFLGMARKLGHQVRKEERIGYPIEQFAATPESRQRLADFVQDLLCSGVPQCRRWEFATAAGEVHNRQIEAYPLKDETGRTTGALLLWEDLTEQLRQEQQRLCRERLRQACWQVRHNTDIPLLLKTLSRELKELFPQIEGCSVQVLQGDTGHWDTYSIHGICTGKAEGWESPGEAVTVCWREQRPVYRPDLRQQDLYHEVELFRGVPQVRAVLDVPFAQGTLAINSYQPHAFDEEEIAALAELAHMLSAGLARLAEVKSQARYRTLVETPSDVVVMYLAPDGRYLYVSPQSHAVTGYAPEMYYANPDMGRRIVYPDDSETARQAFLRVAAGGPEQRHEIRFLHRDGTLRWRLQTLSPILDEAGQSEAVQVIFQDITQRKQAEEALALSELRLRLFIDANSDLVFLKDLNLKYQLVNAANAVFFGRDEQDILGKTDAELMPEQVARAFRESDLQVLGRQQPMTTVESVGGRGYEAQKFPVLFKGELVGVAGIIRDITERRAQEARLQQAAKMESLGRLAGGVAHDFNNMLGVILGHVELAMDQVPPDQPLHADLTAIRQAGERSAALTRQLLGFARRQTVAPKVLDLNETVEGMLKMLRPLLGENLDLAWLPGQRLGPVRIDPAQLDQILANLCVNARDAIEDTGKVTIETQAAVFDEYYCAAHAGSVPGEYVLLAVSDNGCGMNREILDQLFEPFFTTKEVGKGTGLGLATVYGIVKQNHGYINVYSEPGQGTTVKIYLPRHTVRAAPEPKNSPEQATARGHETILLVEDEPAILKLIPMLLQNLGYTVLVAATPGAAMQLAQEHPGGIHLLLTDVVMPEMNGRELARNLLSLYPALKCLFMSGYTANIIAHHGVLDKGVHFIQKPFSVKDLAARVREALEEEE